MTVSTRIRMGWVSALISLGFSLHAHAHAAGAGAFVHLFEWKWADIARECETHLGPMGVSGVQISPPNEHNINDGRPWYERYQPVSYRLDSRSGSRAELIEMVKRCRAAGVAIYADVVINHMAQDYGTGIAGTPFEPYEFPGLYGYSDFNHCGRNGNDEIKNYDDLYELQSCELFGMPDLDTGSPRVRAKIASYLADLRAVGVAGFRVDAAKHIPAKDLEAILRSVPTPEFSFSEVIDGGSNPAKPAQYFGSGHVSEFRYGYEVSAAFRNRGLWRLFSIGQGEGWIPSEKAVVFIDNHDTQRAALFDHAVLTHREGALYELSVIFMLAYPYGTPAVMSSYRFSRADQGPPTPAPCYQNGWVCEHRWDPIAPMYRFRQVTKSEPRVTDQWSDGGGRIAFGRGAKGFVAINANPWPMDQRLRTSFRPGTRVRDLISGREHVVGGDGTVRVELAGERAMAVVPNF